MTLIAALQRTCPTELSRERLQITFPSLFEDIAHGSVRLCVPYGMQRVEVFEFDDDLAFDLYVQ